MLRHPLDSQRGLWLVMLAVVSKWWCRGAFFAPCGRCRAGDARRWFAWDALVCLFLPCLWRQCNVAEERWGQPGFDITSQRGGEGQLSNARVICGGADGGGSSLVVALVPLRPSRAVGLQRLKVLQHF